MTRVSRRRFLLSSLAAMVPSLVFTRSFNGTTPAVAAAAPGRLGASPFDDPAGVRALGALAEEQGVSATHLPADPGALRQAIVRDIRSEERRVGKGRRC